METLKKIPFARIASLVLLILVAVACGPDVIKGRPPFVSISGMNMDGDRLRADFAIANQNGVEMNIDSIEIAVRVNTSEITRYESRAGLLVDANSSEEVSVSEVPEDFTRALLASLDSGELGSLSFDLDGRVNTREEGILRFEYKGYLYTVPGKPGHYRSAVTQAKGLVREDPR